MPAGLSKDEVRLKAMEEEVRLARQQGLDGLLVDFWAEPHPTNGQRHFISSSFALLDAAERTDPGFKILPAVYAKKDSAATDYANSPVVKRIAKHPAALRLPDGRLAWSMWRTECLSVEWWKEVMAQMEANGHPIALVAQFNSWGKLKGFSAICYGMAHWGPRTPMDFPWVKGVRPLTEKAVFPICMQDVRTRGCALWEAEGSATLRSLWQGAIEDGADWAFIYTLTDYSEQAQAPSTCIGFVPYDLNAYYIQWFKTGEQPGIVRDRLYYFHRRHHTDVDPGRGRKWRWRRERDKGEPRDEIELLAFLAKPGALRITIDGQTHEKEAPKGITSFKAPLSAGTAFVPEFSLLRNGQTVVTRKSRYAVTDRVEYPNLLYCAGVIASE